MEFLPFESLLSPDWSCMLAALQQMQRVRSLGAARLTAKLFLLSAANGCISRPQNTWLRKQSVPKCRRPQMPRVLLALSCDTDC